MSMESIEPSGPRPGRPREFDLDAALDAALGVFWRNGYEGASLSELTEAMGISRPSLYAAFGNKEGLFRRALDRYSERATMAYSPCHAMKTAREFIECVLRTSVDGTTQCSKLTGCFLIQGAISCGAEAEALRREVAERRAGTGAMLLERFARAAADGELPKETDPAALADFYATVLQGIALQAVNGLGRPRLQRMVNVALRVWPAPAAVKKRGSPRRATRS